MPFAPGVARSAAPRRLIAALFLAALAVLGSTLISAPSASAKTIYSGGVSSSGLEAEIPESTETPVETENGEIETREAQFETGTVPKARLGRPPARPPRPPPPPSSSG